MWVRKVWGWISERAFNLGAAPCFGLVIYFTFNDKLKAALVVGGLFVLTSILHYMPQIQKLKGIGVEVELKVKEAKEILEQIKGTAGAAGKASCHTGLQILREHSASAAGYGTELPDCNIGIR